MKNSTAAILLAFTFCLSIPAHAQSTNSATNLCSFENLSAVAKAIQANAKLGSCQFKNVVLTPAPKDPCKGSLSFEVKNDDDQFSKVTFNTEEFSDYSSPDSIDPSYLFTLKEMNPNPDLLTITTLEYTLFKDQTKSIEVRDFSIDSNYKNNVNVVCQDI